VLPEIRSSAESYGIVAPHLPPAGASISGVAGDQHAALFGQACFAPGMAKNTYGTGCFLLMNTGREAVASRHNLVSTVAWKIGGVTEYALEGSVFVAGAAIQWLRDELKLVDSAAELDQLAASVPDAGGALLVPAFAGLGAPHWDPYARGTLVGLTRGSGRAQICRAVLESIALQSADLIECMASDSGVALKELRVDGGAARSAPLLQIQADLLGVPVLRPKNVETTALGAAALAGLAAGVWPGREEIARRWELDTKFVPAAPPAAMKSLQAEWRRAVARAKDWARPGAA
jgi:glycerol kinase